MNMSEDIYTPYLSGESDTPIERLDSPQQFTEVLRGKLRERRKQQAVITKLRGGLQLIENNTDADVVKDEDTGDILIDADSVDKESFRTFLEQLREIGDSAADDLFAEDEPEEVSPVIIINENDINRQIKAQIEMIDSVNAYLAPIVDAASTADIGAMITPESQVKDDRTTEILRKRMQFTEEVMRPLQQAWLQSRVGGFSGRDTETVAHNIEQIVRALPQVLAKDIITRKTKIRKGDKENIIANIEQDLENALTEFQGVADYCQRMEALGFAVDINFASVEEDLAGIDFIARVRNSDGQETAEDSDGYTVLGQVKSSYRSAENTTFMQMSAETVRDLAAEARGDIHTAPIEQFVDIAQIELGDWQGHHVYEFFQQSGNNQGKKSGDAKKALARLIRSRALEKYPDDSKIAVVLTKRKMIK
jgi:hypothetical protein